MATVIVIPTQKAKLMAAATLDEIRRRRRGRRKEVRDAVAHYKALPVWRRLFAERPREPLFSWFLVDEEAVVVRLMGALEFHEEAVVGLDSNDVHVMERLLKGNGKPA